MKQHFKKKILLKIFIFFLFEIIFIVLPLTASQSKELKTITLKWGDGNKCEISKNQKWLQKPIVDSKGTRNILYLEDWLDDQGDLHTWYDPETGINHVYQTKNPSECTIKQTHEYTNGDEEKTNFTPPDTGTNFNVISEGSTVSQNERFAIYLPPDTRVILETGEKEANGNAWEGSPIRYLAKFDFPPDKDSSKVRYTINDCAWRFIPPSGFEEKKYNGFDVIYSGFYIPSSGDDTYETDKYKSQVECRLIYSREEDSAEPDGPDGSSQKVVVSRTYSYQTVPSSIRVIDKQPPSDVKVSIPSQVFAGSVLTDLNITVKDNNPNITVDNSQMSGTLTFNPPGIFEVEGQENSNITFDYESIAEVKDFGSGDKPEKYWSESRFVKNGGGKFPFYFRGKLTPITAVDDGYGNSTGEQEKPEQTISVIDNLLPNMLLKVSANNIIGAKYFPGKTGDSGTGESDLGEAMKRNPDYSDNEQEWMYKISKSIFTEDTRLTFQIVAWDNIRRVQLNSDLGDAHIKNIQYAFFNSGLDIDGQWQDMEFRIHPDNAHGVITYPMTKMWRRPKQNIQLKIKVTDNADYDYEENDVPPQNSNQRTLTLVFDIVDTQQSSTTLH